MGVHAGPVPRKLEPDMLSGEGGWSPRRLNALAGSIGAATYLEVGVARGDTLRTNLRSRPHRCGPCLRIRYVLEMADESTSLHEVTSDQFFQSLAPDKTFDLVFLDGLHSFEQTYRDVCNVLLHSHPRTVVLIDDTKPRDVYSALPDSRRCVAVSISTG